MTRAYLIRGALIALRRADAEGVQLEREELVHPAVGEAVPCEKG